MTSKWIYSLNELGKGAHDLVGKKCANLGELIQAGFRVPNGFALTLSAYEKFMEETGIVHEIEKYVKTIRVNPNKPDDTAKYNEASRVIRQMVENKNMPGEMEDAISQYYQDLYQLKGTGILSVAVRSAGPASHPGQYETFLYVSGKSNVLKNIKKVWSSTFNQRSLIARHRIGLPLHYDPIGVGIILMVDAKSAGVMFTLNPINGDPSKIMIEGNWGLGESVVSGSVTPDKWTIDKVTFEIIESIVSTKHIVYEMDRKTNEPSFLDMPPDKQNIPCLKEDEMLHIAKTGKMIEQHFGKAQDIEWAVGRDLPFPDNIFILQTRPTQVRSEEKDKQVFKTGKTGLDFIKDVATWGKL